MTQQTDIATIFDRLPYGLFQPLASRNRRNYWNLIVRLYEEYFSHEVDMPENGYTHRDIVIPIERFIQHDPNWVDEGEGDVPISVRANQKLAYLLESGWLVETTHIMRRVVEMRPDIQQFLEMLISFSDQGPQFLGGKVQMIYSSLRDVELDPYGSASTFHEVSKEVKRLVSGVGATRTQVSELMKILREKQDPGDYVASFFQDYISKIYIADYKELRTTNHPLRHRNAIMNIVSRLRFDRQKNANLRAWYEAQDWGHRSAEEEMARDFRRYAILERIESHLDRLNAVVVSANKQAMAFIHYRMRNRGELDRSIDRTLEVVSAVPDDHVIDTSFAPGPRLAYDSLASPKRVRTAPRRPLIKKRELSPRQKAINALMLRMRERRTITPEVLSSYLDQALGDARHLSNDDLPIRDIQTLCSFMTLNRLGAQVNAQRDTCRRHKTPIDGFEIQIDYEDSVENNYLIAPRLSIRRTGQQS